MGVETWCSLAGLLGQQHPDWGRALSTLLPLATPNPLDQKSEDQQDVQGPRKLRESLGEHGF